MLELVVDRAYGEIAFQIFECLFDLYETNVVTPQLSGVGAGQIGVQPSNALRDGVLLAACLVSGRN